MKALYAHRVKMPPGKTKRKYFDKMEAIALGVQARFEESTSYSKRVTDETINVAHALGISDAEIERWAIFRLRRLARETEKLKEIKSLLDKVSRNRPGAVIRSAR
jgi:hypothetical protein